MRHQIAAALVLVAVTATSATAGRIFGDVKVAGKPAPEGILITIQPVAKSTEKDKGAPIDSVKTDKVGSYKVVVKEEGKCTLTVHVGKKTATLDVFSYKEPTRYDLIVEEAEGKLTVKRK